MLLINKIFQLEFEDKITPEQGQRLRQLYEEGYDVSLGLKGRISGMNRVRKLSEYIETGNEVGIDELIAETKEDDDEIQKIIDEAMKVRAERGESV
jgi:hypothetical protein